MLPAVSQSKLLKNEKVARIQLKSALHVARCFFPMAFPPIDHTRVLEYIRVVGQRLPGDSQLAAGPSIVAETIVEINGQSEMSFPRTRLKTQSSLHRRIS